MRKTALRSTKIIGILFSAIILIGSSMEHITEKKVKPISQNKILGSDVCGVIKKLRSQYIIVPVEIVEEKTIETKEPIIFKITSYDLSIQSCAKSRGEVGFGITKNGTNLKNKSWENIKVISVDPNVIPLNVKVELIFVSSKHKKYSGIYETVDTGPGIIGNRVDLFLGDFHSSKPSQQAINFGIGYAKVIILEN